MAEQGVHTKIYQAHGTFAMKMCVRFAGPFTVHGTKKPSWKLELPAPIASKAEMEVGMELIAGVSSWITSPAAPFQGELKQT